MKSKKGFTLVELLAVIVILAVLATIATPIVLTVQKNIKGKMFDAKDKMIRSAAVMKADKERLTKCVVGSSDYNSDSCKIIVEKLCPTYLAVDKECGTNCCQKNPVNGENMDKCYVQITYNSSTKRYKADLTGENKNSGDNDYCKK